MFSHGHGLAWCGKLTCFKRSSLVPRKESQGCCNGPRPGAPFLKCSNGKCKDLLEFGKDRSRGILRHEKTSTMNELNRVTNRTQESVARKYLPSIPSVLYCRNMLEICWKYVGNMLEITGITCPMCYPLALGAPARPSHPIRSQMEAGIRANVGTVFVPRTCQKIIN